MVKMSRGKQEYAVGTVTGLKSLTAALKLSQYRRAEDAADAVNQYNVTLSNNLSREITVSGWPSQSAQA